MCFCSYIQIYISAWLLPLIDVFPKIILKLEIRLVRKINRDLHEICSPLSSLIITHSLSADHQTLLITFNPRLFLALLELLTQIHVFISALNILSPFLFLINFYTSLTGTLEGTSVNFTPLLPNPILGSFCSFLFLCNSIILLLQYLTARKVFPEFPWLLKFSSCISPLLFWIAKICSPYHKI